jgi:hypothetical protein
MNEGIELERAARLGRYAPSKSSSTSSASSTSRLKGVPSKPVDLSEDLSRVGAADDVLDFADDVLDFGEEFGSIRWIDVEDDVADEVTPVIKKTEPVTTETTPPKKEVKIAAPKASDASVGPGRIRGTLSKIGKFFEGSEKEARKKGEAVKTEGVEPVTTGTTPPKKEVEIAAPKASDASVGPVREEGARLRGTLINDAAEAVKTEGVEPVTKRVGPPPPESGTTLRNVGTEPAQPTLRGTGLTERVYSGSLSHEEEIAKIEKIKSQKEKAARKAQERLKLEAEKKERKAARRARRQAEKAKNPVGKLADIKTRVDPTIPALEDTPASKTGALVSSSEGAIDHFAEDTSKAVTDTAKRGRTTTKKMAESLDMAKKAVKGHANARNLLFAAAASVVGVGMYKRGRQTRIEPDEQYYER